MKHIFHNHFLEIGIMFFLYSRVLTMFLSIFVLLVKYQNFLEQHICITKKQENVYVLMEDYSMPFILEICV